MDAHACTHDCHRQNVNKNFGGACDKRDKYDTAENRCDRAAIPAQVIESYEDCLHVFDWHMNC